MRYLWFIMPPNATTARTMRHIQPTILPSILKKEKCDLCVLLLKVGCSVGCGVGARVGAVVAGTVPFVGTIVGDKVGASVVLVVLDEVGANVGAVVFVWFEEVGAGE